MLCLKVHPYTTIVASVLFAKVAVSAYTWPSPHYDALEEFLYEGIDKSGIPIATLASGCISRLFEGGPSINAEWLRLVCISFSLRYSYITSYFPQAYHDMATHNVTDGTGGLDSSILFELDRAEVVNLCLC